MGIATRRETQRGADLGHPRIAQMGYPLPQAVLRDCDHIVKVRSAWCFHAVGFI
jgi:hypothetical protein